MKRWKSINIALRKVSDPKDLEECMKPYREQIQKLLSEMEKPDIKVVYRRLRADILSDARVSLAVLDATAFEESGGK